MSDLELEILRRARNPVRTTTPPQRPSSSCSHLKIANFNVSTYSLQLTHAQADMDTTSSTQDQISMAEDCIQVLLTNMRTTGNTSRYVGRYNGGAEHY